MTFKNFLFIFLLAFAFNSAKAFKLSEYDGEYMALNSSGNKRFLKIESSDSKVFATFIKEGWTDYVSNKTTILECSSKICEGDITGLDDYPLKLEFLENGKFIYKSGKDNSKSKLLFAPTGQNKLRLQRWQTEQFVDERGVLHAEANAQSKTKTEKLSLFCVAPSHDTFISFELPKLTWRALVYSNEVLRDEIQIRLSTDKGSKTLKMWNFSEEGLVESKILVDSETISLLKKGSKAKFQFLALKNNGEIEEDDEIENLVEFDFSLRNSSKSIESMQNLCVGKR